MPSSPRAALIRCTRCLALFLNDSGMPGSYRMAISRSAGVLIGFFVQA